jgi:hypothetical protein
VPGACLRQQQRTVIESRAAGGLRYRGIRNQPPVGTPPLFYVVIRWLGATSELRRVGLYVLGYIPFTCVFAMTRWLVLLPWMEATNSFGPRSLYVLLQQKAGSSLLRETIGEIADKLKSHGFIRIHRSVLVNSRFVDSIEPGVGSEYVLRTKTSKEYHVTRTFRENLRDLADFWIGTEAFHVE